MATVPPKTLSWLYNVLGREYRDPNRAYSDLAQTLSHFPAFAPCTDVYTFENGSSALLVHFVGTIPVTFRGAAYRFPIALWIPYAYPYEAPLIYVTPTEGMFVRPGQHVSSEGRVYHHYLAHWGDAWDKSNIVDFLSILSDVFAKEPPVISKQQIMAQSSSSQPEASSAPPPLPPLPHELQRSPSQSSNHSAAPPARPTLPPKEHTIAPGNLSREVQRPGRYDAPPPLPPQPGRTGSMRSNSSFQYSTASPAGGVGTQYLPQRNSSLRQSMMNQEIQGPPNSYVQPYQNSQRGQHSLVPQSGAPPMPPHASILSPQPQRPYSHTPPQNTHVRQSVQQMPPQQQQQQQHLYPQQPRGFASPIQDVQSYARPQQYPPQQYQQQLTQQPQMPLPVKKAQPVDLLDSPFDIPLPAAATNLPAPPIPRNPEKDALLTALSLSLTHTLHNSVSQNSSALPSLQAQHVALVTTVRTLDAELANLTALNSTLTSNVNILQSSIHSANGAIASAHDRATRGDVPDVDEMLTAPTVVGKQLYDVVCEERGIEAGIWALQEGFVRGRIGGEVWAKKTRELAREGFRRGVLAEKIGKGLGLDGT